MNYTIEKKGPVTVLCFTHKLNLEEVFEVAAEVARIDGANRRLWDVTHNFDLSRDELERLAERGRQLWPKASRVAYLAADDLAFGLLRMLEVFREETDYQTKVFRSKQKAMEWLLAWKG